MKDFANIPNSNGSFPDVVAQDCTGPGETDGTALTADTMTDYFGFIQALLNKIGDTPSGSAETALTSQVFDALSIVPFYWPLRLSPFSAFPGRFDETADPDWWLNCPSYTSGNLYWLSYKDSGLLHFPFYLPYASSLDFEIQVVLRKGAARSGTDRMSVSILKSPGSYSAAPYVVYSQTYDDGTSGAETIVMNVTGENAKQDAPYYVQIKAGNDAATNRDVVEKVYRGFVTIS